jgi:4-amino-4-deoxy-L-arabinose transferase-like glycosyltransferase
MSAKTKYLCFFGILIIAGFFRFYHLTTIPPGLYMDEAMDGVNAQNVAQTGQFKVYYPEDNGREGLYVNILAVAFKYHLLPETAPWSVRVPAAIAGVLTVLGLYLLVSELFTEGYGVLGIGSRPKDKDSSPENSDDYTPNPKPYTLTPLSAYRYQLALLSAFLLATSFWHINFSRIGFRAILAPFCLVWATYLLIKLFRTRTPIGYWLLAIGAGIIYGAGFYTYIAFRITPLLLLLFVPFFHKNSGFWKRALLFLIVAFLVAAPIGWYYLHNRADFFGRTSQISISNSKTPLADLATNVLKTAAMFNWRGDGNWRHNIANAPELFWPVGLLFLVGIVICLIFLFSKRSYELRDKSYEGEKTNDAENHTSYIIAHNSSKNARFAFWFLFAWFVLGALPEVLSNDGIPHALRSLLVVIPTMVFAAIGAIALYRLVSTKLNAQLMAALATLFIAIVIAGAYTQYFISWAKNPNVPGSFNADYVAIGNEINALPSSTQKYVVIYASGVIDYGLPMPVEPVLYVTNSFVPDATAQKVVKNIHYLLPSEVGQIPAGTPSSTMFEIR